MLGSLVGRDLNIFAIALVELILTLFIVIRKFVLVSVLISMALSIFIVIRYETILVVFALFAVVIDVA